MVDEGAVAAAGCHALGLVIRPGPGQRAPPGSGRGTGDAPLVAPVRRPRQATGARRYRSVAWVGRQQGGLAAGVVDVVGAPATGRGRHAEQAVDGGPRLGHGLGPIRQDGGELVLRRWPDGVGGARAAAAVAAWCGLRRDRLSSCRPGGSGGSVPAWRP